MKRLVIIVCCLLLVGCSSSTYNKQVKLYNRFVTEASNSTNVTKTLPFDIEVYFEKYIDDEITYRVIIDNPKENIRNIKAIAIHNHKTEDVYPTSGLFEKPLNLIPNVINKKDNDVKGIILIGYINYSGKLDSFKTKVKVLIEYENDEHNIKKVYYEYQK